MYICLKYTQFPKINAGNSLSVAGFQQISGASSQLWYETQILNHKLG